MVLVCLAENVRDGAGLDPLYVKTDDDGAVSVPAIRTPPCRQLVAPTTLSGGEFSHTAGCTDTERRVKDIYIQRELEAAEDVALGVANRGGTRGDCKNGAPAPQLSTIESFPMTVREPDRENTIEPALEDCGNPEPP